MAISKSKIASIRRLHQKKFRQEEGLFLVESEKAVLELLQSRWEVAALFASSWWIGKHIRIFSQFPCEKVSPAEMERITTLKTAPEVVAVVRMPPPAKLSSIPDDQPLLLLDGIRDPGNLGTIIRTADWFGIRRIVCDADCVEYTNPKVIQASMGSFLRVEIFYADLAAFLPTLSASRNVYGAFMEGDPLPTLRFTGHDIVVIGNEGRGISDKVLPYLTRKVTIPYSGGGNCESLNASIAAAIFLYEMNRKI